MKARAWLGAEVVWVEATARTLHVVRGSATRSWRLERGAGGALTEACRGTLKSELTAFLDRKAWQPRWEARGVIAAGGVTLRRWTVPNADEDATRQVLALRIEGELPLGPDELAWGWVKVGQAGTMQDVLVAAIRRTSVGEIAELLAACGLVPRFTLAALARAGSVEPRRPGGGGEAWLDIGAEHSEWLALDEAGPVRLRILPWGEQTVVREWTTRLGVTHEAAARWMDRLLREDGAHDEGVGPAWEESVRTLASLVPSPVPGGRVRLTGRLADVSGFAALLSASLGPDIRVESGEPAGDRMVPAGLRSLRDGRMGGAGEGGLWLSTEAPEAPTVLAQPALRKWGLLAAALLLAVLAIPYLEAVVMLPRLAERVAAVKANKARLETIDQQVDFLRHLRQNQMPYLEALLVLGKTAPPGSKMDSLNLNRKGEMALRIAMRQPPEVTGFRTKLTDSGFFSSVVIEEQSPTPDRQKIQVRISAQIKPANLRQGLKVLEPDAPSPDPASPGAPGTSTPSGSGPGPVPGPGGARGGPPRPLGVPMPVP